MERQSARDQTGANGREDMSDELQPSPEQVAAEPKSSGFLAQIEACRRDVAQWPEWMRQERTAPAWMTNDATDL